MTHTNVSGAEKKMASQWTRANSAEKKVPHTRIEDESDIQVDSLKCSACLFPHAHSQPIFPQILAAQKKLF